ncbi:MAG: hypothetical protein FJ186_04000 [Gammaproteobacteria bacterium]|nr:hypothetical protein [Gammaproteobacteria bacterium]
MLISIAIKNFILIESCTLDLDRGLTVITGPTGSGKSMLLKAIAFALGELDINKIHANSLEPTSVKLTFDVSQNLAVQQHMQSSSGLLSIERHLMHQKSNYRLNGENTSLKTIKLLSPLLVCWQRQHAQLALTDPKCQRELIDQMVQPTVIKAYYQNYQKVQALKAEIKKAENSILDNPQVTLVQADLEVLTPIAHLSSDDIQMLYNQYKNCLDLEKNEKVLADMHNIIQEISQITATLSKAARPLKTTSLYESFEQIDCEMQNNLEQLAEFMQQATTMLLSEIDPSELKPKISLLNELSRRFHRLPELLPECFHEKQTALDAHCHAIKEKENLTTSLLFHEKSLTTAANELRENRIRQAQLLVENINQQLPHIGLETGKIQINIQPLDTCLPDGADRIEFLASMNIGHPLCPLKHVLSGGELTRIALILNLYTQSPCQTLLLDEVDNGVSGAIAQKIGQILRQVSKTTTSLCITHTPQVAASGHWQWQVKKIHDEKQTHVTIQKLTAEERALATAQIIATEQINESALQHARALLLAIENT